jgi:hypothetical protein
MPVSLLYETYFAAQYSFQATDPGAKSGILFLRGASGTAVATAFLITLSGLLLLEGSGRAGVYCASRN